MTSLSQALVELERHDAETEAAVGAAVAAEIEAELGEADSPLGSGYDAGPVLEHEP